MAGGGVHPANPFPRPDDWIELSRRVWHDHDAAPLLQYPWLRRRHFVYSNFSNRLTVALADLAGVPAFTPSGDPAVAARQVAEIAGYERRISSGRHGWPELVATIPDGAMAPDALAERVLAAYRNQAVERLPVRLNWPISNKWVPWIITMDQGTTSQIEAAFTTGKLPKLGDIG